MSKTEADAKETDAMKAGAKETDRRMTERVYNMNKKEILEIRKQFTPANCAITRICGCYVDHEKEKKMESKEAFLSLPEEEAFKYFDIFKKTLSGTVGKNILNMEFPIDAEMPGGTQEFLLKLRSSKLQDDMLLEEFYDKVIEAYDCARIITLF